MKKTSKKVHFALYGSLFFVYSYSITIEILKNIGCTSIKRSWVNL